MIDLIFIIKFTVAVGSVLLLSELFERLNPKIAGLLSGYPVGVALALFFFGLENGAEFASRSALFNIVGIVTFLTFIGVYFLAAKTFNRFQLTLSTILATVGFLIVSYLLQGIEFTIIGSVLVALLAIVALMIPFNKIRKIQTGAATKVTFRSIAVKAFVAGSIITGITTVANAVGPEWAGLLASFPSTTLPLMLMVHRKYSTMHLVALLKYIPIGSISIVAYVLSVYYFYPKTGIYVGTLISYAFATIPIILLFYIVNGNIIEKTRSILGMANKSKIHFIITGGTIDFHYDRRHDTVLPNKESAIPDFIDTLDFIDTEFTELFIKDSRKLTGSDFRNIVKAVEKSPYKKLIITTGTFKIDELAKYVIDNSKDKTKTVILTGSTTPITGFTPSEGLFNLGHAVSSVQTLESGVYISFNGELFAEKDISKLIKEGGLSSIFQVGITAPII